MHRTFLQATFLLFALAVFTVPIVAAEPAWRHSLGGPVAGTPTIADELILVTGGNTLAALDMQGELVWRLATDGLILSAPALAGNRIYVHTSEGLVAIDGNRDVVWKYAAEDRGALIDGRSWGWGEALFGDPWAYYRSSPLASTQAIVFGSSDGVHAVHPETGQQLWHVRTGPVTADIVQDGNSVIVADWNNHLRRLKIADGSIEWTFKARLPVAPYPNWIGWTGLNLTPVIAQGQVLLGSRGTYFYAIDVEKGTESWSNKHGTSWVGSSAVVHEKQVYFGLSDGEALIGIDIPSGNQSLFIPAPGPVFATPVVHGRHLIAGTLRGELLVADLTGGRLIASHPLHNSPRPYNSYFQPDPDSDLSPYEFTVQAMERMKREQQSVLSMAITSDLLIVGTGAGEVLGFHLENVLPGK